MILILIVVLLFFVFAIFIALKKKSSGGSIGLPYLPEQALFSAAERSFLGVLDQAVGSDHRVFGKVRVADLARVKPGLSNSARQGALNRIAAKHFDFVICRASDLTVVCAVELNDKSHSSKRAQARDQLIEGICKAINLPLLQIAAKQSYSHQDIRSQFHASIGQPQVGESVGT